MTVEIERVELRLRLDATITMFDDRGDPINWFKPGSEAAVTWRGGIPTDKEIALAYKYLHGRNTDALDDALSAAQARMRRESRGG
jgi:hypothetical protein